jgi:hypothetical protein
MNIISFIEDERFIGDTSLSDYQKVLLKIMYGLPLDRREKRIFRECTKLRRYKPKVYRESTIICGRRSGKSNQIASNVCIYEAALGQHEKHLSLGETGTILLIATSKRQAQVDFGYIRGKLKHSEILEGMIVGETKETISLRNGIQIAVYPCSEVAARGLSVVCAVLDELAFFKHEGVSIDKQIVDSIRPSLIQFPGSKLVKTSSPSKKSGVVHQDHKEHFGKDSEVLVFQAASYKMNPQISKQFVDGELTKDRAFAASEYMAQFKDDIGDYVDPEDLDAVISDGRRELPYIPNMQLFGFADPSGGKSDDMTLSIAGREPDGRIVQVCVRVRKPPFNPQAVVKEFSETLKAYNLREVAGDRYGGNWVQSAFQNEGIMYECSELNKSQLYLEFLPLIMQQRVTLLDIKEQTIQFRQLERKAGRNLDIIDHPRGLKDDISNSCAGACVLASRVESFRLPLPSLGYVEHPENLEDKLARESRDWLTGRRRKKGEDEDEDFDPEEWDINRLSPQQVKDELLKLEEQNGQKRT